MSLLLRALLPSFALLLESPAFAFALTLEASALLATFLFTLRRRKPWKRALTATLLIAAALLAFNLLANFLTLLILMNRSA